MAGGVTAVEVAGCAVAAAVAEGSASVVQEVLLLQWQEGGFDAAVA